MLAAAYPPSAAAVIDFGLAFHGHTLSDTSTLSPAYLSTIDVLLISYVFNDIDVPITLLSASEQTALTSWGCCRRSRSFGAR